MSSAAYGMPQAAAASYFELGEYDGGVSAALDSLAAQFRSGDFHTVLAGMARAQIELTRVRKQLGAAWSAFVAQHIAPHPLMQMMRRCPLTARCAMRPRGYAGDATMIDYIYGVQAPSPGALDPVGRAVFSFAVSAPACRAVRYRRYRLAALLDRAAAEHIARGLGGVRVLSVAAGHARELDLSVAFRNGLVAEYVALDQDVESLSLIEQSYASAGVKTLPLSVRALVSGKHELAGFDVVYAAGLYDYLDTPLAKRLTARLFDCLAPGGKLLYANFANDIPNVGYMETAMDWWLRFRDREELLELTQEIKPEEIAASQHYLDPDGNIHFLELERR